MTDKLTMVFDTQDRMWTYDVGCWGNDVRHERFDTLEKLARYYGPLRDSAGAYVDCRAAAANGSELEETCRPCVEGRCHWGAKQSEASIAAVRAGRDYIDPAFGPCRCNHHEASVRARKQLLCTANHSDDSKTELVRNGPFLSACGSRYMCCSLRLDHDGDHQGADGTTWPRNPKQDALREDYILWNAPCQACTKYTGPKTKYGVVGCHCRLTHGHYGPHQATGIDYTWTD